MEEKQRSNEWYTPAKYIEAAREVMNGIDLDPASCEVANQTVKAKKYYTQAENGLEQSWYGNIWCNPPFSRDMSQPSGKRSGIAKWVNTLLTAYEEERVTQAIFLAPANMYAHWFRPLWNYPICFPDHQVWFYVPNGSNKKSRKGNLTDAHMFGTAFIYLGPHEQKFIDTFSQFGRIAKAIDTPRRVEKPIPLWDVERIYA